MESQRAAAPKRQSLAPRMGQLLASLTMSAPMTTAELEAAIAALPAKKQRLRESFDRLVASSPIPLPFTWDDIDAHVSSVHEPISLRFLQLQALQAPRPTVSVSTPVTIHGDESEEDEEMVITRNDEDASAVSVDEVEKHSKETYVRLAALGGEHQAGRSRTHDQERTVPTLVHVPDAGNPMFQHSCTSYHLHLPTSNPPMLHQQEYHPAMAMQAPKANYNVPAMVQQPYITYGRQEQFPHVIGLARMDMDNVLQHQYMAHYQHPYHPAVPSNNDYHPLLRQQPHMTTAENIIQKDIDNRMVVNKTTNFKKKGNKSNKKGKPKGDSSETDAPRKSKTGPTPDTECFFCKERGHWKRNCKKYLAEKKLGKIMEKYQQYNSSVLDNCSYLQLNAGPIEV